MSTYLETINRLVAAEAARHSALVQFGENIAQGSRICGLARNLTGRVLTVGNCENTHVGVGLGMMMEGGEALLVVKQLDFLLLALDQMVNTLNLIRAARETGPSGSFTILTIICDQGWQGPQSSFHNLQDICSLARCNGYFLNGRGDAERVIASQLVRPGFRLIAVSQRRFQEEALDLPVLGWSGEAAELQYAPGEDAAVVALGFALPQALEVSAALRAEGKRAAVFQVNPVLPHDWPRLINAAARSRRLIIVDDTRGPLSLAHKIVSSVLRVSPDTHVTLRTREQEYEPAVNEDRFAVAV